MALKPEVSVIEDKSSDQLEKSSSIISSAGVISGSEEEKKYNSELFDEWKKCIITYEKQSFDPLLEVYKKPQFDHSLKNIGLQKLDDGKLIFNWPINNIKVVNELDALVTKLCNVSQIEIVAHIDPRLNYRTIASNGQSINSIFLGMHYQIDYDNYISFQKYDARSPISTGRRLLQAYAVNGHAKRTRTTQFLKDKPFYFAKNKMPDSVNILRSQIETKDPKIKNTLINAVISLIEEVNVYAIHENIRKRVMQAAYLSGRQIKLSFATKTVISQARGKRGKKIIQKRIDLPSKPGRPNLISAQEWQIFGKVVSVVWKLTESNEQQILDNIFNGTFSRRDKRDITGNLNRRRAIRNRIGHITNKRLIEVRNSVDDNKKLKKSQVDNATLRNALAGRNNTYKGIFFEELNKLIGDEFADIAYYMFAENEDEDIGVICDRLNAYLLQEVDKVSTLMLKDIAQNAINEKVIVMQKQSVKACRNVQRIRSILVWIARMTRHYRSHFTKLKFNKDFVINPEYHIEEKDNSVIGIDSARIAFVNAIEYNIKTALAFQMKTYDAVVSRDNRWPLKANVTPQDIDQGLNAITRSLADLNRNYVHSMKESRKFFYRFGSSLTRIVANLSMDDFYV